MERINITVHEASLARGNDF